MWRVGDVTQPHEQAIDVAFDADMNQQRGDLSFRAEDHPDLDSAAAERLLTACRDLIERLRREGKLRVRGFVIRAFGGPEGSAALMSVFTLGDETTRTAAFSYAVVGVGAGADEVRTAYRQPQSREWTPRFG
jgi:hypothetical protein